MKAKKIFFNLALGAMLTLTASDALAQIFSAEDFLLDNPALNRNGEFMTTSMNLELQALDINSNQAVIYTPMIVNGPDTLMLQSVGIYGRRAWYQFKRGILKTVPAESQIAIKYNKDLGLYTYAVNVPYTDWMNGSNLLVKREFYGCGGCNEGQVITDVLMVYQENLAPAELQPTLIYKTAVAEEIKARELSGRAYVDFPVNKIVIYPDYRNNAYELGKIIATIDSVKNDPDITVTSIFIAGTASPEGPYDNNVYLAKNRTIALKDYVTNLYNFPKDFIQTDYDPVDWKGLREWLELNSIKHKNDILAIVNSDIEPYARNSKIKKDFPTEYQWLLTNVYPALRHSDYRIEYQIRQFTNIEEIAEVMKTSPQKLSLNEMYTLASSLQPGTPEFNEVFETAVRMYPEDETANLNAANAALAKLDLSYAEKYLKKAGNSAEAEYARGILHALRGDYEDALVFLRRANAAGIENIEPLIEQVENHCKYNLNTP